MIGGNYTFGKSIDNASSIGGGGQTPVMNDQSFRGERGLSSFDIRHHAWIQTITMKCRFGERKALP